ncbi:MAG: hypothetical protein RL235_539 [Chlamydiota bacterium]|jgi:hypothetical protein
MAQLAIVDESMDCCRELEKGNILFFKTIPFAFPAEDISFLLAQKQGSSRLRKNISYKPDVDVVHNHSASDKDALLKMHAVLRRYSANAVSFLRQLLPQYADAWRLDYASFRPFQEKGRPLRLRARNDLLHVDAFPTRPLYGDRILRFFTNINPHEPRVWHTSGPFKELFQKFYREMKMPLSMRYTRGALAKRIARSCLRKLGIPIPERSPYDDFMLRFHHFLKEHALFQETCHKDRWEFPPRSCWAVFTDQVSHAALSGQYALEQTIIVPRRALLNPEEAPASILERATMANWVC